MDAEEEEKYWKNGVVWDANFELVLAAVLEIISALIIDSRTLQHGLYVSYARKKGGLTSFPKNLDIHADKGFW